MSRSRDERRPGLAEHVPGPVPDRPRLADGVEIMQEPLENGMRVVRTGDGRYIRVAADMARLLTLLDGRRSVDELTGTLAGRWSSEIVETTLERVHAARLLDDGTPRTAMRRSHVVSYVPPLTFQLTVVRPARVFAKSRAVIDVLMSRRAVVVGLAVALLGLVSLALQLEEVHGALSRPLPIAVLLAVVVASFATSALHEIAHGAALTKHGGEPGRLGVMLFYLTPAFFCDVTDGWRLGDRRARVRVALAGIFLQYVVVGLSSISALLFGGVLGPLRRDALLIFSVSTLVTATMNLIPFVKLDGYIALMSSADIPFLRERALVDARRALARLLFGGRYERELPDVSWSVPFGLASMAFPLVLVGTALQVWLPLMLSFGTIGALALAILGFLLGRFVLRGWLRVLSEARSAGASRWRGAAVTVGCAAALGATAWVPVPYAVTGGFIQGEAVTYLVVAQSADVSALEPGTLVSLQRRGVVSSTQLADAAISEAAPAEGLAPLSVLMPVVDSSIELPVTLLELDRPSALDHRSGFAVADAGSRPLAEWLYLNYVAQIWR